MGLEGGFILSKEVGLNTRVGKVNQREVLGRETVLRVLGEKALAVEPELLEILGLLSRGEVAVGFEVDEAIGICCGMMQEEVQFTGEAEGIR